MGHATIAFATAWCAAPLDAVEVDGAALSLPAGLTLRAGETVALRR